MKANKVLPVLILGPLGTVGAWADWNLRGYVEVASQPWFGREPYNDRGLVIPFHHDVITTTVGERVYVHIIYTECPHAAGGGESYYITYRRGYYDIAAGPGTFAWDAGFENGGQIISGPITQPAAGRFKMEPVIVATADNRLYAFWADSRHCDESSGVWDNIEIYGNTAAFAPQPPTWTWLAAPRRVSEGPWYSGVPAVTVEPGEPPLGPHAFIFWRDGREALPAAERTDIYAEVWSEDLAKYPAGGARLAENGGLTVLSADSQTNDTLDGTLAAATDAAGNIHLVWSDQRPGDPQFSVYYKARVNGVWSPTDLCLAAACQVSPRTQEFHPEIAVITLPGAPEEGRDLCVLASTGYFSNYPIMYIYESASGRWYYLNPAQCGFGEPWRGTLVTEKINNTVHILDDVEKTAIKYHRGFVTTAGVNWDRRTPVQIGDPEVGFPSLALDNNGVLHALYWRYRHDGGEPQVITSVYYENDGGGNCAGR